METLLPDEATAVTVSDLLREIGGMFADAWPGDVWVLGELSNVRRYSSGHFYMTLKDGDGEISCIMFKGDAARLRRDPAEGVAVAVLARPAVYAKRGAMQLTIREIRVQGQGRLHEEYLRRKEELRRHGWFDEARKRPIPRIPHGIGVVASAEGAVWKDVRTTLAQRFASIPIKLFRAPAQGEGAAAKIAAQIARADADDACAVILLCRGGGSFEDLWAYSEAPVVKAIHSCATPVIAGIGHDSDESLADHVADLRAATPTAAAVAATAVTRAELLDACAELRERLGRGARACVAAQAERLDRQSAELRHAARETVGDVQMRLDRLDFELDKSAADRMAAADARLRELRHGLGAAVTRLLDRRRGLEAQAGRLAAAVRRTLAARRERLASGAARMRMLNPQRTLERGYALVSGADGRIATRRAALAAGAAASISFADGALAARIEGELPQGPLQELDDGARG